MDYRPDRRGVRELLNSAGMQRHVLNAAEDGAEFAKARAPRVTGRYAHSIQARAERAGDRVGATVTATVPYAQRVEQQHHVIAGVVDYVEHMG